MGKYYFNSTIKRKQCPSCELKNKLSGDEQAVRNGLKAKTKPKATTKKKKPVKSIDKALDNAWSKLVKLIAGNKCEHCGKTKYLNSHHIYSRAKKSVRWKTINGICLCVGCHIGVSFSAHKTPIEFMDWLLSYKGDEFMQKLRMTANSQGKYHDFEKQIMLDELNKSINNSLKNYLK